MDGFIKIHRKILDWEWYNDINTCRLFIHCLILANHKDKKWRGIEIKRGSFITSLTSLSEGSKLSVQNVRTALSNLKSTHELTINTTTKYTIVTICNYNLYHQDNTQTNKQLTNNQQTTNKQLTTTKNDKNEKNDKKNTNTGDLENFQNFLKEFNQLTRKSFRDTDGLRTKYYTRRKTFSVEEIGRAMRALLASDYHTGKNDRGMFYATPEFLLRSDEQIDKWLNSKTIKKPKFEHDELMMLAIKNGVEIQN